MTSEVIPTAAKVAQLRKTATYPADRMLDWAITHGSLGTDDARAVAKRLGKFT
jgi:hypothetical protein